MEPDGAAFLCHRGQSQGGTHLLAVCKLPERTFRSTVPMPPSVGALGGGPFDVGDTTSSQALRLSPWTSTATQGLQ